ncbi:hypothetical protein [Streptomyces sp. NPDC058653]|uniref:hypothetical protein n=1 Tax=Streptomyces sp. NPDC058653 TaxID=3346576 RepID=UPI0036548757
MDDRRTESETGPLGAPDTVVRLPAPWDRPAAGAMGAGLDARMAANPLDDTLT